MTHTTDHGHSLNQMVCLINSFGGSQLPLAGDPDTIKVTLENFASNAIPVWNLQAI